MRPSMDDRDQPIFNDIRIDLRSSRWVSNPQDQESDLPPPHRSVPSRIPRYAGREEDGIFRWNSSVFQNILRFIQPIQSILLDRST